ncbi:MAG: hypothetical protein ACI828_000932 [Flavobacteriales bacterium]|jgi:hypothetical protein
MIRTLFIALVLIPLISLGAQNQTILTSQNNVEFDQSTHFKRYAQKLKSMGMVIKPDAYYQCKININKHEEFKENGLDLVKIGKGKELRGYRYYSLLSRAVVEGVVVEKTYITGADKVYHTNYKFKVLDVVKGKRLGEYINIKGQGGMLDEDTFVNVSHETNLLIGEKIMIMLYTIDIEKVQKEVPDYSSGRKNLNLSINDFLVYKKYILRENSFFDENKNFIGNKLEVYNTIKEITQTNESEPFEKVKF